MIMKKASNHFLWNGIDVGIISSRNIAPDSLELLLLLLAQQP